MDWPAECGEKIGLRQNLITIPITKYKNITETIRIERIINPDSTLPDVDPTEDPDKVVTPPEEIAG